MVFPHCTWLQAVSANCAQACKLHLLHLVFTHGSVFTNVSTRCQQTEHAICKLLPRGMIFADHSNVFEAGSSCLATTRPPFVDP